MLSSRLEAVFDEFLFKVKEEFKIAKTGDGDQKKIKKIQNAPNYEYKEEKSGRLDNRPSFMFKKKNLLPGWYSPLQSRSTELKAKYPKTFNKFDKYTNECLEERMEKINKKRDELRKRAYVTPNAEPMHMQEPNLKKCICKHHKAEAEPIYDTPTKTRYARNHFKAEDPRNQHHFKAEGSSMIRPQLRPGHLSKKAPALSTFTLTSVSTSSSQ